jgi:phosphoglycerate dehydrogenase-like enzyme
MKVVDLCGVCSHPDFKKQIEAVVDEFIIYEDIVHDEQELLKRIDDAEIVISFLINISENIIKNAPNLKLIVLGTTGFNCVDLKAAQEKGVQVCYAPGYATSAVAEHTVGLMLGAARLMLDSSDALKKSEYDHTKYTGKLLKNKNLGVIGYGRIGQQVARIAEYGLGMKVIEYDVNSTRQDLEKLLKESDVITLHLPLTKETENMFGEKEFALMKDGIVIVNTARGKIIDEEVLLKNVKSGKVFAAGLDVLKEEPMHCENPLVSCSHVIVTPHTAYNTEESMYERSRIVTENVVRFVEGKPQNLVTFCKS